MKENCKICNKEFGLKGLGSHVVQKHEMNMQDYLEKYYNFPKSVVEWRAISIKDVIFAQDLLDKSKEFDNFYDMFQNIYDTHDDMRKMDKVYGRDMGKFCICLGVITNRNLSEERKKNLSQKHTGKKLSEEHKLKISEGYHALPQEKKEAIKKKLSIAGTGRRHSKESIMKMIKNRKHPHRAFRGKAGKRKDLDNVYFRSTWEANFARVLRLMKVEYQFEPNIFWLKRSDGADISYTPDFYLSKTNEYIEVKGYWMDDAKMKFDLFRNQYPDIKIKVVDSPKYKMYEKRFKHQIEEWE